VKVRRPNGGRPVTWEIFISASVERVLRLGLLEDGGCRVGVFPESEEILTGNTLDKATTSLSMSEACRRCHGRGV